MAIYVYKHPDTDEHREVIQGMNDEHIYIDEFGVEWGRVWTIPHASIDSSIDPFNKSCSNMFSALDVKFILLNSFVAVKISKE